MLTDMAVDYAVVMKCEEQKISLLRGGLSIGTSLGKTLALGYFYRKLPKTWTTLLFNFFKLPTTNLNSAKSTSKTCESGIHVQLHGFAAQRLSMLQRISHLPVRAIGRWALYVTYEALVIYVTNKMLYTLNLIKAR